MLKKSTGYSLTEVLISTAMLSFIVGGVGLSSVQNSRSSLNKSSQIVQLRESSIAYIKHPVAWQMALDNEANKFQWCRDSIQSCSSAENLPLNLYSPIGKSIALEEATKAKFNSDLTPCSLSEGECAYSVSGSWNPICTQEGDCSQANVNVKFYAKGTYLPQYDINVKKNTFLGNLNLGITYTVPYNNPPTNPIKAKLIVIVDNSNSMANNLISLRESFKRIINQNKDLDFDIKFYTTSALDEIIYRSTNNYIRKSSPNQRRMYELSKRNDMIKSPQIEDLAFRNELITTAVPNVITNTEFEQELTFDHILFKDRAQILGLTLNSQEDPTILNGKIDQVFQNLLDTEGHYNEAGLCALNRIIKDQGPFRAFDPTSERPFFLIMSDENDATLDPNEPYRMPRCMSKTHYHNVASTSAADYKIFDCYPYKETCEYKLARYYIKYFYEGPMYYVKGFINYLDGDEKSYALSSAIHNYYGSAWVYDPVGRFGLNPPKDNCSPEFLDFVISHNYIQGLTRAEILSCEITVSFYGDREFSEFLPNFWVDKAPPKNYGHTVLPTINKSATTCDDPFQMPDGTMIDLHAYLKQKSSYLQKGGTYTSCRVEVSYSDYNYGPAPLDPIETNYVPPKTYYSLFDPETPIPTSPLPVAPASPDDHLVGTITQNAIDVLGPNQLFLSSITHVSDALCPADNTGAKGTLYHKMVAASETPTESYNICDTDYNISVSSLMNIIKEVQNNTLVFDSWDTTKPIEKVVLIRGSEEIVVSSLDYSIKGNSITFKSGLLVDGDKVSIILAQDPAN